MSDLLKRFKPGQRVSWLNAYGDTERGTVTGVTPLRVNVDMTTIGGRPRRKIASVFFPELDAHTVSIDDTTTTTTQPGAGE